MKNTESIKQFDMAGLAALAERLGEKGYRGRQLAEWLYVRDAHLFSDMNNLPHSFRALLAERYALIAPEVVRASAARDGTTRYLLKLGDGLLTETVAIPSGTRLTVCFSTQVGCALGCVFCATGRLGFTRNLLVGEMVDQLAVVAAAHPGQRVSNVVAMGQGEPFANYDATLAALRMINDARLFGIGARHITVSTAGLLAGIERFAAEPEQFTLAVSLHSAVPEVRDRLMPGLAHQPIAQLREALLSYMARSSRRPSLEYALIEGVNDDEENLASLLAFCRVPAPGFHVNLIRFNAPADASELRPSGPETEARFEKALAGIGVSVTKRVSKGAEVAAACGQLACSDKTGTDLLSER